MLQEVYEEKRNIIMSMITGDWQEALSDEFRKDYYKKLYTFVKDEYNSCVVYPPADDIFNAFHFTPLKSVKVLILGQDPYHEVNQAHGLSFSVLPGNPIPKSLHPQIFSLILIRRCPAEPVPVSVRRTGR